MKNTIDKLMPVPTVFAIQSAVNTVKAIYRDDTEWTYKIVISNTGKATIDVYDENEEFLGNL